MKRTLLFCAAALALALAAPARAQQAAEPGAAHEAKPPAEKVPDQYPSCPQILGEHELVNEHPEVAEVIFHHITDNYAVEFENPFGHGEVGFNFKRMQCSLFGWNGVVELGEHKVDLTPTKHTFWMWVAAALLIALFWVTAPKKGQLVPRGVGAFLEIVVVFIRDEIARKNIPGKDGDRYTPYLLNCFFFIFAMNALGLIPYCASATSNVGVTLGLALFTFVLTQVAGIRSAGLGGYIKHLTGGMHPALWPIMIPVEFLGLFTKPFALTLRLFANMVAGHIVIFFLIGLIFILKTAWLALVSVPFAFGIYLLELFVALVQAYVFTMLSSLFIGMAASMGHHGAHDEKAAHH